MQPTNRESSCFNQDNHLKISTENNLVPSFDSFQKYLQTYTTAFHFQQQIKLMQQHYKLLHHRIARLEEEMIKQHSREEESDSGRRKIKRRRRLADQIDKQFVCEEQRCQKSYGTLGSLQQHQRLKHPELFPEHPKISTRKFPSIEEIDLCNPEEENFMKPSAL